MGANLCLHRPQTYNVMEVFKAAGCERCVCSATA